MAGAKAGRPRWRLVATVAAWVVTDIVLGFLLCVPLGIAVLLAQYVAVRVRGAAVAPFGDDELPAAVFGVLAFALPLVVAAVTFAQLIGVN